MGHRYERAAPVVLSRASLVIASLSLLNPPPPINRLLSGASPPSLSLKQIQIDDEMDHLARHVRKHPTETITRKYKKNKNKKTAAAAGAAAHGPFDAFRQQVVSPSLSA